MSRKWALLIVFCALVGIGFAARGPLVSTFFQWYLKGYCRSCFDSRLSYQSLHHDNGQWILEHPVVTSKTRLEQGGFSLQAERATVEVAIDWSKRSLGLNISVDAPVIDIGRGGEELRRILRNPDCSFGMFYVHTHYTVPQGTVLVHDFTEDHLVPVPLFFSIELACRETPQGCAAVWLGSRGKEKRDFTVVISQKPESPSQLSVDFHDVDCAQLQQVLGGLWPGRTPFEVLQGRLIGNIVFTCHALDDYRTEGLLAVHDAVVCHPKTNCQMIIPDIKMHLTSKETTHTVGHLDLSKPSKIMLFKDGEPYWTVDEVTGSVLFQTGESAIVNLGGYIACKDKPGRRHLTIDGRGCFAEEGQTSCAVDIQLMGQGQNEDMSFHFSARQLGEHWSFGELELLGFGHDELALLLHLAGQNHPEWHQLHIKRGSIDAAAIVYLKGLQLSEVQVERLAAHHLQFEFAPWELSGSVDSAIGSLSFDLLAHDPVKTFNANLTIKQGRLNLVGLDKAQWDFSGIQTNLSVRNGVIQKSLLKGMMAGLKGEIILDGTASGPIATFNFHGPVRDFSEALPEVLRNGLEKQFSDDTVNIAAEAVTKPQGLLFTGKLMVGLDPNKSSIDETENVHNEIAFGFSLEKSSQGLWRRWPPHPWVAEYCSGAGCEVIHVLTPAFAAPLDIVYRHLIKQGLGFGAFAISDGWFEANNLPLHKFISPFIFRNGQIQLSGVGDFKGEFDEQKLVLHYDAHDMIFDSINFNVEIPRITRNALADPQLTATYVYDFDKQQGFNTFSIYNGTYFEKNSGLLFTEVNTKMSLENDLAHFTELSAFCNGLNFCGAIDLDWGMPGEGVFTVAMQVNEVHGKMSQLQHFMTHINKDFCLLKIPIEGNITLQKAGAQIFYSFYQGGYDLESRVLGTLTDGTSHGENMDMSLRELSLNFDYDHVESTFEFSDIQGTVLVGKPDHVEEYVIGGNALKFTNFTDDEAEFDLWVADKKRHILRLAGTSKSVQDALGERYIEFDIDKRLSHLGDMHPKEFQLAMRDWSQVDQLQLEFDFQLKTLLADLQRFNHTGLFFLSRNLLKELNDISIAQGNMHGNFLAALSYDGKRSVMQYLINGDAIVLGSHAFDKFQLSGTKKGALWSVDQLQFDDISLAFDVLKEGHYWNINFLGVRVGDSLLIGMEGQYCDDDAHLEGKINLLEAKLGDLSQWPSLKDAFGDALLLGDVRASGTVHVDFDKTLPKCMRLDAKMTGSLKNGRIKGLFLEDVHDVTCHYNSIQGVTFHDIGTGLKSNDHEMIAGLFVKKAGIDFLKREISVEGLHFNIPATRLEGVAQLLNTYFPNRFSPRMAEALQSIQIDGALQGSLGIVLDGPRTLLRLTLNDGKYRFMGMDHDVRNFVLDYHPTAIKVQTQYIFQRSLISLEVVSSGPAYDRGELKLADLTQSANEVMPLIVEWTVDPAHGCRPQKMTGTLCGLTFNLASNLSVPSSQDTFHLTGRVDVNMRKAVSLLDEQIAASIQNWQIGEGYALTGQWGFSNNLTQPFIDGLTFQGEMIGQEFEFLGYRFNSLSTQLSFTSQTVHVRNMILKDPSATMHIAQMDFWSQQGAWQVAVPLVNVNDLRPSLLRLSKAASPKAAKALVVRTLDIRDLSGTLGDRNSFKGSGQLFFSNPPKKNLQHTIFAIPAEILTRIGLDLSVLTPVRGTIFYELKDGKAAITRFKDVYSKGKVSKFLLPNNGYDSYVDFDGNVHMQVKMKQYNLIFKLAELFTVTVQGTLKKPTYSLQKQQVNEERSLKNIVQSK